MLRAPLPESSTRAPNAAPPDRSRVGASRPPPSVRPAEGPRRCRRLRSSPPPRAPRRASARKHEPMAFASASTARVSPPTAAASSRFRPRRSSERPSASASTMRSPSRRSRTSAQLEPRAESPEISITSPVCTYRRVNGEPRGPPIQCPTLPMSPPRSEPGRTRWVPCGPARLPTRRDRRGLPRFGLLVLHWIAEPRTGSGTDQRTDPATRPGRSSSGSPAPR